MAGNIESTITRSATSEKSSAPSDWVLSSTTAGFLVDEAYLGGTLNIMVSFTNLSKAPVELKFKTTAFIRVIVNDQDGNIVFQSNDGMNRSNDYVETIQPAEGKYWKETLKLDPPFKIGRYNIACRILSHNFPAESSVLLDITH